MPKYSFSPSWRETSSQKSARKRERKNLKKAIAVGILVLGGLAVFGLLMLTVALAWISRDLPEPNTLMLRDVPLTTKIYDRTGEHLLYEIHGDENRTLVQIKDLPSFIPQATVAIEDKNFYTHHGVDWRGLARAVLTNVFRGHRVRGTSTLTQQFVKNAVLTNKRSYARKLKEILLSLQMERVYSKDQILQLYLNEIPYGSTMYGIESAARGYFGKAAKDLTLDEAALLAAIPQAPDVYSPYGTGSRGDNRERLVWRQRYVLTQMATQGYITIAQSEDAKRVDTLKKLVLKKLGNISAPHFVMYIKSLVDETYGQKLVERGGLKVITTLDWDKQHIAEDEIKKGVEARGKQYRFTNASLVSIDPKTGQLLAMVGSKDFFDAEHDGQVNVAFRPRQPGSSFKPIVYAAGFIKGYSPETTLWDVNTVFKTETKDYEPKNYNLREHGPVSVRQALQGSLNIPAVKMMYLVGVGRVLDFAEQLGYSTFQDRGRFGLALVLGGGEVKLLEHTNAYAAFANNGVQMPISAILRVEDSVGRVLEEWRAPAGVSVMDRDVASRISDILSDNASRAFIFGLKNYLILPDRQVAAKTGTTNNFHDAWALGYTPSLVTGVWVGNNDNSEMRRGADGSQIAAPIWQRYMRRALEKAPIERFQTPTPTPSDLKPILLGKTFETNVKLDAVSGKRATEYTPPETIVERTFREAHDTLFYLDKDDPRGPAPDDPTRDPQYEHWERAVQNWVNRTHWISPTSTPPAEFDDVHTTSSQPVLTIVSPTANQEFSSRVGTVRVSLSATRSILRIEIYTEGNLIGASSRGLGSSFQADPLWNVPVRFPNSLDRGFHDLEIIAIDDIGNKGRAKVTINLNAETISPSLAVTHPASGSRLRASDFPVAVSVEASDFSNAAKVDLYLQTPDGSTRLLDTEETPRTNVLTFTWKAPPSPATYVLFPVLVDAFGNTRPGERTTVSIE